MSLNVALTHKDQTPVAYSKAVSLLQKHGKKTGSGTIPYAECCRVLGWLYHLDRGETFIFLGELEELGLVRQVPYHGIKINSKGSKK